MIGGHVKPKNKSVLIYSRDALAGPLRRLQKLMTYGTRIFWYALSLPLYPEGALLPRH